MRFRSLLCLIIILFGVQIIGVSQNTNGLPFITNFEARDYKAGAQNWGLVVDSRGKLLVANNHGLLSYDGNKWGIFEKDFEYLVSTISVQGKRIFVGGNHSAGFIDSDSSGKYTLNSLLPLLVDSVKEFGIVRKMIDWQGKTVFHSDYYLFVISGNSSKHLVENEKIINIFNYRKNLYLLLEESGLMRYENGRLMQIPGGQVFQENTPIDVITYQGEHFFLSSNASLYHLVLNKFGYELRVTKKNLPIAKQIDANQVKNYYELGEDRHALNVEGKGLIIVDAWTSITHEINHEKGLQDEVINGYFLDEDGSLWLALENGISKIELNYPVRQYNEKNGLEGTVEGLALHKNGIYAASNAGIFAKDLKRNEFFVIGTSSKLGYSKYRFDKAIKVARGHQ